MQAKYPGWCNTGKDKVLPGQIIVRSGRGWRHSSCPVGAASLGRDLARRAAYVKPTAGDWLDDAEIAEARRERERDNAEYAAGVEDANRYRFNRQMFGDAYAAGEEYERDLRGLNGDW